MPAAACLAGGEALPCDSGTVTQQLAAQRPVQTAGPAAVNPTGLVAAAAAIRGAAVAAAGLILATGLATIIWAMTPGSGPDVAAAMRGGVLGFAAANLMPIDIGGVTLSLPPLLFTLMLVVLLASTARRGRFLPEGRYQETVSVLITALVYGVIVAATTRGFGPPDAVGPQWVWTAPAIALGATGGAMLQPGSAWHQWCVATLPRWLRVSIRGGGVGLGMLLAGGGLAVTVGLISHFGDVVSVAALAAPSWMDGAGLALLGLAYLPNAVIAGAGYATGVGFEIGAGTYSPFSTIPVDLPAIPLLAAVPDAAGRSWIGLIFLAVPVAAGFLISRVVIKRLATRADRALAAGAGALLTGGLLAAAVAIARGGVGDGRWSTMGSPPLLIAAAVTVEVGVIAVTLAGLTGVRTVPWRAAAPAPSTRSAGAAKASLVSPSTITGKQKRRSKRAMQESDSAQDRPAKKGRRSKREVGWRSKESVDPPMVPTTEVVAESDPATSEVATDVDSGTTSAGASSASGGDSADENPVAEASDDVSGSATVEELSVDPREPPDPVAAEVPAQDVSRTDTPARDS